MATIHFAPLLAPAVAPLAPATPLPAAAFPGLVLTAPTGAEADGLPLPVAGVLPDAKLPASLNESAAMRPDQVFMARQLAWPAFDGATLGANWRALVNTYGQQLAALQQQARDRRLPAASLMAGQQPAVLSQDQQAPLQLHPDAWRFVLPGAGGRRFALRVLAGRPDQAPGRRRRGKLVLRLELTLADGSRALVQLEPLAEGVLLELAAERPQAVEQLRLALPALKTAIGRAGVAVLRADVRQALAPGRPLQGFSAQTAAALSPQLFRAMAEAALLLSAAPD